MKWFFSFSIGALVTTAGTPAPKGSAYVDTFLGVEIEEYKVKITGLNGGYGSSISTGALFTTKGTAALGDVFVYSIGAFVTTCYSSSLLSTDIG